MQQTTRAMDAKSFSRFNKLNPRQKKDCILITEVKRYKFLYDRTEMNHKRSRHRRSAWDEIGTVLGMDGIDCMNRWKILRDKYRKEKRKRLRNAHSRTKKWIYYDMCSFLDPYLEDIKPFTEDIGEGMNQREYHSSAEDSSQDFSKDDISQQDSLLSLKNSTQLDSSLPDSDSAPLQFIRIIVPPTDVQQTPESSTKASPRKYVKILPKTQKKARKSMRNGLTNLQKSKPLDQSTPVSEYRDQSSNDSSGLSPPKSPQKQDTVDHLMAFMGNTIKQLTLGKQIKICQELTSAFFTIISNEDEAS